MNMTEIYEMIEYIFSKLYPSMDQTHSKFKVTYNSQSIVAEFECCGLSTKMNLQQFLLYNENNFVKNTKFEPLALAIMYSDDMDFNGV
jgi:hypothetical protein